jgi:predicted DNA-binding transcriptional regulator AlpA
MKNTSAPLGTPKPTVDERDASHLTGFSTSYLRQARMRRVGPPFIKVGRAVRYRVEDLDQFLDSHRVETRSR